MPLFKRCLALINTRSGAREGRSVFASALQQYLDHAGILHKDILLPENDVRHALRTHLPNADGLIVCGGDGTISSVVNVLASVFVEAVAQRSTAQDPSSATEVPAEVQALLSKPIALVPTGLQNSIAHSLGVSSAERSVSQFVVGRVDAVPVWEVRLNGRPLRYICSYLAVGTYAHVVARFHQLESVGDDYVALPSLGRHKFKAAAFYSTVVKEEDVPCDVELVVSHERPKGESTPARETDPVTRHKGPMRMLLAAQMPLQHGGYSLTPSATYKHGRLSLTTATTEASRLRMWHLMRKEAVEGYVLTEDGVATHDNVAALRISIGMDARANPWDATEARDEASPKEVLVLLDGEQVRVPLGSVLSVQRMAGCTMPFLIC